MNGFILKGDICYSKNQKELRCLENGCLVCVDRVCKGAFSVIPDEYGDLPIHDYSGCLILPGLADLHVHAPQYAFRGMGMDKELLQWLDEEAFPEESKYADLNYAETAYGIFASQMRKSATTRAVIFATRHREATELLMDLMEDSGLASYVGKVNMDRNSAPALQEGSAEESLTETRLWLERTAKKYRRTRPIITPRFTPTCSDGLMEALGNLRAEFDVPVQSHLSENLGEIAWVKELCPWAKTYGDAYDRFKMFGGDYKCVMAHCVHSNEEELSLIQRNNVYVAHCPACNMNVSSGIMPLRRYLDRGLLIGLGSDVAGGHTESLFSAMAYAIQSSKVYWRLVDQDCAAVTFPEAFWLATRGGGSFFGNVGAFEDGYEFDAVVLDDSVEPHPQRLTVEQRAERAVYLNADRSGIRRKYVAGKMIL